MNRKVRPTTSNTFFWIIMKLNFYPQLSSLFSKGKLYKFLIINVFLLFTIEFKRSSSIYIYINKCMPAHLPIYLPARPPACPSACSSAFLSAPSSASPSPCLTACSFSPSLPACLHACLHNVHVCVIFYNTNTIFVRF